MSRLIDADKLKHVVHCAYSDDLEILKKIDEQPTAFDVDKVVEQLEDIKRKKYRACQDVICEDCKYSKDCCECDESDKLALDMAVEIVKGGGVE
jgi:hypothetical protein